MREAVLTFAAVFGYAVLRYVVFKGVPADQMPLFVANKAVSVTALVLLALAWMAGDRERRIRLGLLGLALAGLHAVASLALLAGNAFPKLVLPAGGGYTFAGGAALLAGSVGIVLLLAMAWPSGAAGGSFGPVRLRRLHAAVLMLAALHNLFLGWSGWLKPSDWPGFLPPITLLSFLIAIGALGAGMRRRHA